MFSLSHQTQRRGTVSLHSSLAGTLGLCPQKQPRTSLIIQAQNRNRLCSSASSALWGSDSSRVTCTSVGSHACPAGQRAGIYSFPLGASRPGCRKSRQVLFWHHGHSRSGKRIHIPGSRTFHEAPRCLTQQLGGVPFPASAPKVKVQTQQLLHTGSAAIKDGGSRRSLES